MLFNMYIYNRKGKCLFYKEWNRTLNTLADDVAEEQKLVYGMLFSLKDLTAKLSPLGPSEGLHMVKTDTYTLHHFQSASGMVFVLNTDVETPDLYEALKYIYSNIYVECVTRNPLYSYSADSPIDSPLFLIKVEEYLFAQSFAK